MGEETVPADIGQRIAAESWGSALMRALQNHEGLDSTPVSILRQPRVAVVAPTQATRGDAWVVRFADPAIISTNIVLAGAREIVSIDTQQRRTLAVIRYRSER